MKIVMTLLVRNAESILRNNIDFHLRQGVDFFIITDNLSNDSTAEIAGGYVDRGLAELISEPDDTFSQARWVTRMARRAATVHGADWVINSDDDEFWIGETTLRDTLAAVLPAVQALKVNRFNHPPVPGVSGAGFVHVMTLRERHSFNALGRPLSPKVCHRAAADVSVDQGNHRVRRSGKVIFATKAEITISHFPVRDYASFERKIALGGAAYERNTELDPSIGATWRMLHACWRRGGLPAWYDDQLLTPATAAAALAVGSLCAFDHVSRSLAVG